LVSIKSVEGFVSAKDHGIVVSLDTTLTPELIEKGYIRELTSKIQALRKDSNFEVTDRIEIIYNTTPKLKSAIDKNLTQIMEDTLCDQMLQGKVMGGKILDINGEKTEIKINKAH